VIPKLEGRQQHLVVVAVQLREQMHSHPSFSVKTLAVVTLETKYRCQTISSHSDNRAHIELAIAIAIAISFEYLIKQAASR
jgi:hypothetical protein